MDREREAEGGGHREGRWSGRGREQGETALAARWEDYPMLGLVAASAAAWTGGSVLEGLSSSSSNSRSGSEQKAPVFSTGSHRKGRGGEHRVQLGRSELVRLRSNLRADSSGGK